MKLCGACATHKAGYNVEPDGAWATGKCQRCGQRAVVADYGSYKAVLSNKREEQKDECKGDEEDPYDAYIGCF